MPEVGIIGNEKLEADLDRIMAGLLSPTEYFEEEFSILEASEAGTFAGLGGYVRTGRLKESLTQPEANGAIRRLHVEGLEFGTSVWYAKFQREIGGPSGKPRGRRRVGPSKVLKLTEAARVAILNRISHRIMGHV